MTLFYVRDFVIPAAFSLLPVPMRSVEATALLLAIALQESGDFEHRAQAPSRFALGFWQAELGGGCTRVLSHPATAKHMGQVLATLRYPPSERALWEAFEHNDVLAAACARLLLWTLPERLPDQHSDEIAWRQYLAAWRPGKPHRDRWRGRYGVAWDAVAS